MKASELIKQINNQIKKHGDSNIVIRRFDTSLSSYEDDIEIYYDLDGAGEGVFVIE